MGKDEHKRKEGRNKLAQTPKNQLRAEDVEFSQSMADQEDLEAQARARAADTRVKNQKR